MRTPFQKFCGMPEPEDIPLKLKPGLAPLILNDERFHGYSSENLIEIARKKLKSTPADRAIAIAVIQGL